MPVFLLWPPRVPSRRPSRLTARRLLAAAAPIVVAASLVSGSAAFVSDLQIAFRYAGRSVLTPVDVRQMDAVRASAPTGSTLLLTTGPNGQWACILWQRALYPDRTVIVLRDGSTKAQFEAARRMYRFEKAVSIGDPPPDPGFASHTDLGSIPGLPGRVWLGALRP